MKWQKGPNARLVSLIKKKTKMKRQDIVDVLILLPECLAQSFFEENPVSGEFVNFGIIAMAWKPKKQYGYAITVKKTQTFVKAITANKLTNPTPLSITLSQFTRGIEGKNSIPK